MGFAPGFIQLLCGSLSELCFMENVPCVGGKERFASYTGMPGQLYPQLGSRGRALKALVWGSPSRVTRASTKLAYDRLRRSLRHLSSIVLATIPSIHCADYYSLEDVWGAERRHQLYWQTYSSQICSLFHENKRFLGPHQCSIIHKDRYGVHTDKMTFLWNDLSILCCPHLISYLFAPVSSWFITGWHSTLRRGRTMLKIHRGPPC